MRSSRLSMQGILLAAICPLLAAGAGERTLRDITQEDIANWKMVSSVLLSPDGRWLAYGLMPAQLPGSATADTWIVIRSIQGETERRFRAGPASAGAGNLQMCGSGRFIAYQHAPENAPVPVKTGVAIMELESGKVVAEIPAVRQFACVSEKLVLLGYSEKDEDLNATLTLRSLRDNHSASFAAVTGFAADPGNARLALIGSGGLRVHELATGKTQMLDASAGPHRALNWSASGRSLAAVRTGAKGTQALLAFTQVHTTKARKAVFERDRWQGFPAGYELKSEAFAAPTSGRMLDPLEWRDDERGLFFYVLRKEEAQTPVGEAAVKLSLWHWRDPYLPSQKKLEAQYGRFWHGDLSFVSLDAGRFVRLGDDRLVELATQSRGRHVLGYDAEPYNLPNSPNLHGTTRSVQLRDYYLVEIASGKRTVILKKLPVLMNRSLAAPPTLSPDGRFVIYQDNGDYFSYEVARGTRRNLTAGLPTKFYYPENPRNLRQLRDKYGSDALQGWSADASQALVSDYYDIWTLPLRGEPATNLTGHGRSDNVEYELASIGQLNGQFESEEKTIDLGKALHFSLQDFKNGNTDAAVATGVVDRERLGLVGHSHGGSETCCIVTRTNLFKAAVPQAGQANMLTASGQIYERDGSPSSFGMEHEQPYFAGPWWDHWQAYLENSPVFQARNIQTPLLIAHGNADKLVPFGQVVEMFNTLRRIGGKPVVLLEYGGMDHAFLDKSAEDLEARMIGFFDHFLKGAPAPTWWAQGISYFEGQAVPGASSNK